MNMWAYCCKRHRSKPADVAKDPINKNKQKNRIQNNERKKD